MLTAKHFHSFTMPEYFLEAHQVERMLEEEGEVRVDEAALKVRLRESMVCPFCTLSLGRRMKDVKDHLISHVM